MQSSSAFQDERPFHTAAYFEEEEEEVQCIAS